LFVCQPLLTLASLSSRAGPISAAGSQLALGAASVVAGQPFSVLITSLDAYGNVQPVQDPAFLVLLTLTTTGGGPPTYLGNGLYNYTTTFNASGLYTVTGTYKQVPIGTTSLILSVIAGQQCPSLSRPG
jgi:hypothetical protein